MKVAVVSGKGGTGKTSLAVSLAQCASRRGRVHLLDCDTEEPDAHLLLRPAIRQERPVTVPMPEIGESCTACGRCSRGCAFHALATIPPKVLLFPELCHGCGLCAALCPAGAIREIRRPVGTLRIGDAGGIGFFQGVLTVGETAVSPVIKAVLAAPAAADLAIVDGPPGTSCPVVTVLDGCDAALVVTEPTPFGVHDLQLIVEVLHNMHRPFAIVVNRAGVGEDAGLHAWCTMQGLPIAGEIPEDRRIAEAYAHNRSLAEARPDLKSALDAIWAKTVAMVEPPPPPPGRA